MKNSKKKYVPVTTGVKKAKKTPSLTGWVFYAHNEKMAFPQWKREVESFISLAKVRCMPVQDYGPFIADQYVTEARKEFKDVIATLKKYAEKARVCTDPELDRTIVFTIEANENDGFAIGKIVSRALGYEWVFDDKELTISFEAVEDHQLITYERPDGSRAGKVVNDNVKRFKIEMDEMKRNKERTKKEWCTEPLLNPDIPDSYISIKPEDQDEKVKNIYRFNLLERAGVTAKPGFNDELLYPDMKLVNIGIRSADKPIWVVNVEESKGKFIRIPGLGDATMRVGMVKLTKENALSEGTIQFMIDIKTADVIMVTKIEPEDDGSVIVPESFYINAEYYTGEKEVDEEQPEVEAVCIPVDEEEPEVQDEPAAEPQASSTLLEQHLSVVLH